MWFSQWFPGNVNNSKLASRLSDSWWFFTEFPDHLPLFGLAGHHIKTDPVTCGVGSVNDTDGGSDHLWSLLLCSIMQEHKNTSQKAKQDVHAHVFRQLDVVSLWSFRF